MMNGNESEGQETGNPDRDERSVEDLGGTVAAVEWACAEDGDLTLPEARRVRARQHIILECLRLIEHGLDAVAARVWTREPGRADRPRSARTGKPVGRCTGSWSTDKIEFLLDERYVGFGFAVEGQRPALAQRLVGVVHDCLGASLDMVEAAYNAHDQKPPESLLRGHEILVAGIAPGATMEFVRGLIEQKLPPMVSFLIGHASFKRGYTSARTVLDGLTAARAATFEGELLQTGIVVDANFENGDWKGPGRACDFPQPLAWASFVESRQNVVSADGVQSFVRVSPDGMVRGIVVLDHPISTIAAPVDVGTLDAPDFTAGSLWLSVVDHEAPDLYLGAKGRVHRVAAFSGGSLRLTGHPDERAEIRSLIVEVAGEIDDIDPLMDLLVQRGRAGRGGGVVIGQLHHHEALATLLQFDPPRAVGELGSGVLSLIVTRHS